MNTTRKSYPSDVSDAEWEYLLPYLTLMRENAPQRGNEMREVFNATRYVVKTGCQWRMLPHDFPDWTVVYQQSMKMDVLQECRGGEQGTGGLRPGVQLRAVSDAQSRPAGAHHDGPDQFHRCTEVAGRERPRATAVGPLSPWSQRTEGSEAAT